MAVVCICGGAAMAQAAPIKMGLWEKTMNMTSGGSRATTIKSRSCITPAEWQRMLGLMNKQTAGCSIQTTKTAKGYSFNGSCENGQMTLSGTVTYPDAEHIVEESHGSSAGKNGQKVQSETRSTTRWIGANCGNVKPGEPEVE